MFASHLRFSECSKKKHIKRKNVCGGRDQHGSYNHVDFKVTYIPMGKKGYPSLTGINSKQITGMLLL